MTQIIITVELSASSLKELSTLVEKAIPSELTSFKFAYIEKSIERVVSSQLQVFL